MDPMMNMNYSKIIDKGNEPSRLFIGGVHGKEGITTIKALSQLDEDSVSNGKLGIYNFDETPYLSTLHKDYYNSDMGKNVLSLIKEHKPVVYLEAHCYKEKSYEKLVDEDRKSRVGVPPLIELEEGVLIGSVAPFLRLNCFKRQDICITLEIPCYPSKKALGVYVNILKAVASSKTREDLEATIGTRYPQQVETARRYAIEFFGDYPPF
ncbi:DUF2119 domain-containing protein [Methanobacterium aggregans]|uniref:DUF2119 domain-containing protein n=2 Tax=Methanobacterium aggregans TaxID=1615586 RepID=UPI00320C617F